MKKSIYKTISSITLISCLLCLTNCFGPSQEEYDTTISDYEGKLTEKEDEKEEVKKALYDLDTEFGNYRGVSERERDSLQTFSENLSVALRAKKVEVERLQEKIRTVTNDQVAKEYITELSKRNGELEELVLEKNNFIKELERRNTQYVEALDSLQIYHYKYGQLSVISRQISDDVDYYISNSDNLKEIPIDLTNNIRVLRRNLDAFIFSSNRMGQVREGYRDLADVLEADYNRIGFKFKELEKKMDRVYYVVDSKRGLKDKNIINGSDINPEGINPYYFEAMSRKTTVLRIQVPSTRDEPKVLSNQSGYELKKESDLVWNLYIERPNSFWGNNNYLVIAY